MCLKTAYCKLTKQEVMFTHKHNQFNGHFHESQVPLPSLVSKKHPGVIGTKFFTSCMRFLSLNQQCQSTERKFYLEDMKYTGSVRCEAVHLMTIRFFPGTIIICVYSIE